jgi:hypothetical protein
MRAVAHGRTCGRHTDWAPLSSRRKWRPPGDFGEARQKILLASPASRPDARTHTTRAPIDAFSWYRSDCEDGPISYGPPWQRDCDLFTQLLSVWDRSLARRIRRLRQLSQRRVRSATPGHPARRNAPPRIAPCRVQETIDLRGACLLPGGLAREAAARILQKRRHVLLVVDPGTGRRTAAVRLLGTVASPRREIRSTTMSSSSLSTRCRGHRTLVPLICSRCRKEAGTGGCGSCTPPTGRPWRKRLVPRRPGRSKRP